MPFLNNLQLWADDRPHHTAVVVGRSRLSWPELRDAATGLLATTSDTTVLAERNSTEFVARYAAALAGSAGARSWIRRGHRR